MWLALDASVQHLRFAEVRMDIPARLFLCARCRVQVVLCSHCDRGNRYCGRPCWRLARDAARRESASRYQRSRLGRLAHAERSRRWRQRREAHGGSGSGSGSGSGEHNVTHQGCPPRPDAALLVAWTPPTTSAPEPAHTSPNAGASTAANTVTTAVSIWRCWRCAKPPTNWVRQGFLRHGPPPARSGRRHDHCP